MPLEGEAGYARGAAWRAPGINRFNWIYVDIVQSLSIFGIFAFAVLGGNVIAFEQDRGIDSEVIVINGVG